MDTLKDYSVVRDGVGMFDLSGTAKILISGDNGGMFLEEMATCSVELIEDGMGSYGLFLRQDGTIVAVCTIFRDKENFILFTAGEKRKELLEWLNAHNTGEDTVIEDYTEKWGLLSIHGFKAQLLTMEIGGEDIIAIPYMGFEDNEQTRSKIFRVGSTGEFEYQFLVEKDHLDVLESEIMEKGSSFNISFCDNQVLDILMIEMKSVNQLRDIEPDTNAIQAGLVWMIDFGKDAFIGRDAVVEQKENPDKKLTILVCDEGEHIPAKAAVKIEDDPVGHVVNQCFSKRLNKDLLLAYIEEAFAWVGIEFDIETEKNGIRMAKSVSSPTFITRSVEGEAS